MNDLPKPCKEVHNRQTYAVTKAPIEREKYNEQLYARSSCEQNNSGTKIVVMHRVLNRCG